MKKTSAKSKIYTLTEISVFTAYIAIFAQISIPLPGGVPLTLQTFAIPLAGVVLGAKKGTMSVLVYILLGAVGAPVFANLTGGLAVFARPTAGFILSFPLMALAAGIFSNISTGKFNRFWLVFGLVAGAAINYLCGTLFYVIIMSCDVKTALAACVLPFIPTAVIKIIMVAVLGKIIKRAYKIPERYSC